MAAGRAGGRADNRPSTHHSTKAFSGRSRDRLPNVDYTGGAAYKFRQVLGGARGQHFEGGGAAFRCRYFRSRQEFGHPRTSRTSLERLRLKLVILATGKPVILTPNEVRPRIIEKVVDNGQAVPYSNKICSR
jgi:hypothetical protein